MSYANIPRNKRRATIHKKFEEQDDIWSFLSKGMDWIYKRPWWIKAGLMCVGWLMVIVGYVMATMPLNRELLHHPPLKME